MTSTVRGLPLALSVAGARRTLLTVEQVSDAATDAIHGRFTPILDGGMSYADAFIKPSAMPGPAKIDSFPRA